MNLKTLLRAACLTVSLAFVQCATVTIRPDGGGKTVSQPTFQERYNYFFWGLMGENTIDVKDVCEKEHAVQMQSQFTFVDGLLTFITLGIYSPKTAKVWCEDGADK